MTTDLATLVEREELYQPDEVIYVVDKRQELHFYPGIPLCKEDRNCKTGDRAEIPRIWYDEWKGRQAVQDKREGGVMRLENLIREIDEEMYKKIMDNRTVEEADARNSGGSRSCCH